MTGPSVATPCAWRVFIDVFAKGANYIPPFLSRLRASLFGSPSASVHCPQFPVIGHPLFARLSFIPWRRRQKFLPSDIYIPNCMTSHLREIYVPNVQYFLKKESASGSRQFVVSRTHASLQAFEAVNLRATSWCFAPRRLGFGAMKTTLIVTICNLGE